MFNFIISALILITPITPHFVTADYETQSYAQVTADYETDPVKSPFDAADDPAIWVHPTDVNQSLIIGSDKKRGIEVYNLTGEKLQAHKVDRINNIDLRYSFPLGGDKVDILGGTNVSDNTIDLWKIQPDGELVKINGKKIKPKQSIYGFAMYHSLRSDKFYAIAACRNGDVLQYELYDNGKGKVDGKLVRTIHLAGKTEGVVADDEYGVLFAAEENGGLYKMGAEPNDNSPRVEIGRAGDGRLVGDIEGLAIYHTRAGQGYLLVSSQGDNSFAVYERTGMYNYLGSFNIVGGKIDGVNDTDGIDMISFGLGDTYPNGFFIAQDGSNYDGNKKKTQNFKMVRWEKIAEKMGLTVDNTVNPRELIRR